MHRRRKVGVAELCLDPQQVVDVDLVAAARRREHEPCRLHAGRVDPVGEHLLRISGQVHGFLVAESRQEFLDLPLLVPQTHSGVCSGLEGGAGSVMVEPFPASRTPAFGLAP